MISWSLEMVHAPVCLDASLTLPCGTHFHAGFHCTSPTTFAESLHTALSLSSDEDLAMRKRAREHAVKQFSEREFELSWESSGWLEWRKTLGLGKRSE